MPRVQFNPEVNYGHLLTLAVLLVSLIGGWFMLTTTVTANTSRIDRHELAISELTATVAADRAADTARQIELVRTLTQMQADLGYLRQHLDAQGGRP
jgi:hypothetical protein